MTNVNWFSSFTRLSSFFRSVPRQVMTSGMSAMLLFCALIPPGIAATGKQFKMNINISGTVVANGSCTFNQGGKITVNFGQVIIQKSSDSTYQLEGNYEQVLASDINCTGDTAGLLQLRFTSATGNYTTVANKKVMGVDKGPVGIELLVNDSVQSMDEWWALDQDSPPVLKARLVKLNDDSFSSGDTFNASGTLTMAFN